MAAPSKSQLLDKIHPLLAKRYKTSPRGEKMSVLEAVLYGICHEGTTREQANQVMGRFKDSFFDWNELRVSSVHEIQNALAGLPDAESKAYRLRRFLRQLFFRTYSFDLEYLCKKPLKESVKVLQEFEAPRSDFVLATVVQKALGGHAMPVDEPIRRSLVRLGLVDAEATPEAIRSTLERAVPKSKGAEVIDLLEELAHDTCVAGAPRCSECVLVKLCPTGQQPQTEDRASTSGGPVINQSTAPSRRRSSSSSGGESKSSSSRGRPPRQK